MRTAEPPTHRPVDDCIILRRTFPAHAADQANRLHRVAMAFPAKETKERAESLRPRRGSKITMLTDNFLRGRRRRELSDDEKEAIESVLTAPVTLPRRKVVTSRGDVVTRSTFLISGFMCRYMDGADGHRQLVSIQ